MVRTPTPCKLWAFLYDDAKRPDHVRGVMPVKLPCVYNLHLPRSQASFSSLARSRGNGHELWGKEDRVLHPFTLSRVQMYPFKLLFFMRPSSPPPSKMIKRPSAPPPLYQSQERRTYRVQAVVMSPEFHRHDLTHMIRSFSSRLSGQTCWSRRHIPVVVVGGPRVVTDVRARACVAASVQSRHLQTHEKAALLHSPTPHSTIPLCNCTHQLHTLPLRFTALAHSTNCHSALLGRRNLTRQACGVQSSR